MAIYRYRSLCVVPAQISRCAGADVAIEPNGVAPYVYVDLNTEAALADVSAAMGEKGYEYVETNPANTPLAQVKADLGIV